MNKDVRLQILLDETTKERLSFLADRTNISMGAYVRLCVNSEYEKVSSLLKDSLLEEEEGA